MAEPWDELVIIDNENIDHILCHGNSVGIVIRSSRGTQGLTVRNDSEHRQFFIRYFQIQSGVSVHLFGDYNHQPSVRSQHQSSDPHRTSLDSHCILPVFGDQGCRSKISLTQSQFINTNLVIVLIHIIVFKSSPAIWQKGILTL